MGVLNHGRFSSTGWLPVTSQQPTRPWLVLKNAPKSYIYLKMFTEQLPLVVRIVLGRHRQFPEQCRAYCAVLDWRQPAASSTLKHDDVRYHSDWPQSASCTNWAKLSNVTSENQTFFLYADCKGQGKTK